MLPFVDLADLMDDAAPLYTLPFDGLPPPSIQELVAWLADNEITHHPGLSIERMESGSGWRITSNAFVHVAQPVASIPKTSILSIRTTRLQGLAERFPVETTPTILPLALALLYEFRLGPCSKFYGYLQSLPRRLILLPLFWDRAELGLGEDGLAALQWLKGTESAREIALKARTGQSFSDISAFFNSNMALFPRTAFADGVPTLVHFLHCYALVSSRAFQTDVYHRPALVPFADLFNHSSTNHIHLETDDFTCPQCGRLAYCPLHDAANPPTRLSGLDAHWRAEIENTETDDCLLVVNKAIMEGEEVYNTYGDVGAGKSLVEYGYVDEDHEQGIEWTVEDLQESLPVEINLGRVPRAWAAIIEARTTEPDSDTLLYQPTGDRIGFGLSSSAQLSVPTLAIIYLATGGCDHIVFGQTIAALERLWAALEMDEEDVDLSPVLEIATAVDAFLSHKLRQLHRPDTSLSDLFAIKDSFELDSRKRLQPLAVTSAILERGLLETARERWRALGGDVE